MLRKQLVGHNVSTAYELGWARLQNSELLQHAEAEGFDVLITTDKHRKYQQNLSERGIGIVVLGTTSWPRMQRVLTEVLGALERVGPSGYIEVPVSHVG